VCSYRGAARGQRLRILWMVIVVERYIELEAYHRDCLRQWDRFNLSEKHGPYRPFARGRRPYRPNCCWHAVYIDPFAGGTRAVSTLSLVHAGGLVSRRRDFFYNKVSCMMGFLAQPPCWTAVARAANAPTARWRRVGFSI
jgi:hypothetical protein